jgi:hypothetical protein
MGGGQVRMWYQRPGLIHAADRSRLAGPWDHLAIGDRAQVLQAQWRLRAPALGASMLAGRVHPWIMSALAASQRQYPG